MENHFDKVAQQWDENPMHLKRTEAIAQQIIYLIENKNYSTALEFGAGTGLLSFALKSYFKEIILMDNSQEMICVTIEKLADADIHHLKPYFFDLEKNDYKAKKVDVIFVQMALHHVIEVEVMIQKFFNILNNSGMLFIADLFAEDGSFHNREFLGHKGFQPEELSQTISKCGFQNVAYQQCFEIKKQFDDNTAKTYPVFIMSAQKNI
jgi:ubiquinone/menaquinone biosynthesis C-methylase UbiE